MHRLSRSVLCTVSKYRRPLNRSIARSILQQLNAMFVLSETIISVHAFQMLMLWQRCSQALLSPSCSCPMHTRREADSYGIVLLLVLSFDHFCFCLFLLFLLFLCCSSSASCSTSSSGCLRFLCFLCFSRRWEGERSSASCSTSSSSCASSCFCVSRCLEREPGVVDAGGDKGETASTAAPVGA